MRRLIAFKLTLLTVVLFWTATASAEKGFILLASTIGPIDAGIISALENGFEKETGIRVRHIGAGSGEALRIAEKGEIDLVMVHARSLEEKFVAAGFGMQRIPFMYNDFVIVGPATDPAGIRGAKSATAALARIKEQSKLFVSRGDNSGPHVAEMELWRKAGINPTGPWYNMYEKGSEGNVPTLRFASSSGAYTIIDRATYLSIQKEIKLNVLVEGDEALLNRISLIPVSPQKFPMVNNEDAATFIAWLTSPEKGQKIVSEYGMERFGAPLFFPDSEQWRDQAAK